MQKVSEVIPFAVIVMKRDFGTKADTEPKLSFALDTSFVSNLSLPSFQLKFGDFENEPLASGIYSYPSIPPEFEKIYFTLFLFLNLIWQHKNTCLR